MTKHDMDNKHVIINVVLISTLLSTVIDGYAISSDLPLRSLARTLSTRTKRATYGTDRSSSVYDHNVNTAYRPEPPSRQNYASTRNRQLRNTGRRKDVPSRHSFGYTGNKQQLNGNQYRHDVPTTGNSDKTGWQLGVMSSQYIDQQNTFTKEKIGANTLSKPKSYTQNNRDYGTLENSSKTKRKRLNNQATDSYSTYDGIIHRGTTTKPPFSSSQNHERLYDQSNRSTRAHNSKFDLFSSSGVSDYTDRRRPKTIRNRIFHKTKSGRKWRKYGKPHSDSKQNMDLFANIDNTHSKGQMSYSVGSDYYHQKQPQRQYTGKRSENPNLYSNNDPYLAEKVVSNVNRTRLPNRNYTTSETNNTPHIGALFDVSLDTRSTGQGHGNSANFRAQENSMLSNHRTHQQQTEERHLQSTSSNFQNQNSNTLNYDSTPSPVNPPVSWLNDKQYKDSRYSNTHPTRYNDQYNPSIRDSTGTVYEQNSNNIVDSRYSHEPNSNRNTYRDRDGNSQWSTYNTATQQPDYNSNTWGAQEQTWGPQDQLQSQSWSEPRSNTQSWNYNDQTSNTWTRSGHAENQNSWHSENSGWAQNKGSQTTQHGQSHNNENTNNYNANTQNWNDGWVSRAQNTQVQGTYGVQTEGNEWVSDPSHTTETHNAVEATEAPEGYGEDSDDDD